MDMRLIEADLRARELARWEGEGGALGRPQRRSAGHLMQRVPLPRTPASLSARARPRRRGGA